MTTSSSGRAHLCPSSPIGRVGALAVALGIGTAVAAGLAAPASADTTGSTGSTDSATSAPTRKVPLGCPKRMAEGLPPPAAWFTRVPGMAAAAAMATAQVPIMA